MIDALRSNLLQALRTLIKAPGVTATAVLSLALGMGANSALFTLMNGALFRPLPYRESERLVHVSEVNPTELCAGCAVGTSVPTYELWRDATRDVFSGLGAYREDGAVLIEGDLPERLSIAAVSAGLFELLGTQPIHGRRFLGDDDRPGATPVVLISDVLWRRRFNADPAIVGRSVRLDGQPTTIIGVMPPRFQFPEFAQAWVPLGTRVTTADPADRSLGVIGRLKDLVSIADARTAVTRVSDALAADRPNAYRNWSGSVTSLREALNTDTRNAFGVLLGAASFVLLIACANLANLLLARAARRDKEFAVRLALGASRGRLAGLLLTESLLLAVVGGAAGLLVATWALDAVRSILPDQVPFWLEFRMDWRVMLFTTLVSGLAGMLFGLAPALHASRANVHEALKESQRTATTSFRRGLLRPALVVGQVALALLLLAGANLSLKSMAAAQRVDGLGYEPRGIVQGTLELRTPRYRDSSQLATATAALLARMQAVPGVTQVAFDRTDFLGAFVGQSGRMTLEGSATAVPDAMVPRFAHVVTPDYFALMRIRVRRGRGITAADVPGAPGVAVVSQVAADRLWPGLDPVGRRFKLGAPNDARAWLTVVGEAEDVVGSPIGRSVMPVVYTSMAQSPGQPWTVLARAAVGASLAEPLSAAARDIDPDAALLSVMTMEDALADWIRPVRFMGLLLGALAAVALALAATGVYGVLSYVVAQRTHEIGVRIALGANARNVLGLVVGQGLLLALIGVGIGLSGLFALRGVLRSVLFGLSPLDPAVLTSTTVVLLAVAVLASYLPARRVLRIDPVRALRSD